MAESTLWWLLAGAIVAVELATGTFYLLMMGIGMVAGAISAHLGFALSGQIIVAAVVGGGAVATWHWLKAKSPQAATANANPDVHIDIGESVHVKHWNADGTASVKYRGANWTAVSGQAGPLPAEPGMFRISELQGNRLVLEKI